MDWNRDTKHALRHKFKEEIIVPLVALSSNIDFILCKGEKLIKTADGFMCRCVEKEEVHICDIEDDIRRIYNMSAWDFIRRWRKFDPYMDSMTFLRIKLEKLKDDTQKD